MQFEVYAQYYLHNEHEHEHRGHGGVDIRCELATTMLMAEEVSHYCEDSAERLERNVPA